MNLTTALKAVVCAGLLCVTGAYAQQEKNTAPDAMKVPDEAQAPQVEIIDIKTGEGAEAQEGSSVAVHYTGWLFDTKAKKNHGKKFDSSYDRGRPITFILGAHRVIPGWEQGLQGLKVGGKRTLIIPSELAYGDRGAGGIIPPDATLIFDVELMAVK